MFKNYKEIIQKLLENNIKVIVQSTLYTRIYEYNYSVTELNKLILEFAIKNNLFFIDLNQHLSRDNVLMEDITTDGIHLNAKGYSIWKKEIEQYFKVIE